MVEYPSSLSSAVFWVLSFLTLCSATALILLENIIYSAFLLGLTLLSIAGLFFLLNADFIGSAQILIYVGAINVLILFAIMLVNKKSYPTVQTSGLKSQEVLVSFICSFIFFNLFRASLELPSKEENAKSLINDETVSSFGVIAQQIFSTHLLAFETLSVLLLAALIGAILIAKNENLIISSENGNSEKFSNYDS